MTQYKANILRDNNLPWFCWDQTDFSKIRKLTWGLDLIPTPNNDTEPTEWTWSAMLPEGTILPDWITIKH